MDVKTSSFKALITLALIFLMLLPLPSENLWWRELYNSGHTILFALITLFIYGQIKEKGRFTKRVTVYLLVCVIGLFIGITTELLQGMLQREASITDLANNLFGIATGLCLLSFLQQREKFHKFILVVLMLFFLISGTFSLFLISWDYVQRNRAFPVLVDFSKHWATSFTRFNKSVYLGISDEYGDGGGRWHSIRFNPGRYPGISVIEPKADWSAYQTLHFDVFSSNINDVELVVRVHDKHHDHNYEDRFNKHYTIKTGLNRIVIDLSDVLNAPYGRDMNMTKIAGVVIFLKNVDEIQFLEVSNIILHM